MKIHVAPLLKEPYGTTAEYDIGEPLITERSEHAALLDTGVRAVSGVAVLAHTTPGIYVQAEVRAEVELECARCLTRFSRSLRVHADEQYYATIDVLTGAPLSAAPRDAYTIGHDFVIEVSPLLREHVLLELPAKPLCHASCAGLCPECGADQSERPHRHAPQVDERWSALRALADLSDKASNGKSDKAE